MSHFLIGKRTHSALRSLCFPQRIKNECLGGTTPFNAKDLQEPVFARYQRYKPLRFTDSSRILYNSIKL